MFATIAWLVVWLLSIWTISPLILFLSSLFAVAWDELWPLVFGYLLSLGWLGLAIYQVIAHIIGIVILLQA